MSTPETSQTAPGESTSTTRFGGHTLTRAELCDQARERFGDDPKQWAFICPNCSDVATPADFIAAGANPQRIGQECIGRSLGALTKDATGTDGQAHATRGCDWSAHGLFSGPWFVEIPDGEGGTKQVPSFALAPAPSELPESASTSEEGQPTEVPSG